MTQIPIDPALREAVIKELARDGMSDEELADGIIRAINRVMYLNAVQQQAKAYAEVSKAVPVLSDRCCCVPGTSAMTENIEYPCGKCPYHARYAKKRMLCFHHRKMERDQG